MIIELPLLAEPAFEYKMLLNNQECTFKVYQKGKNLFFDLWAGDENIVNGAVCLNFVPVIQVSNPAFTGNFVFIDLLGDSKPSFSELGTRYFCIYYTNEENLDNVIKMAI